MNQSDRSAMLSRRPVLGLVGLAAAASLSGAARAQTVTIPIIVKDTTSQYWQVVLAGARKAGRDLGIRVPELGAQSEADIAGQISALENAVAGKPAAIVIAPTQFAALGAPVTEAAKSVKIVGIDSAADSKAFTSFLTTDNVQGGRQAADALAASIAAKTGKAEGPVALILNLPGVGSLDQRAQGFKEQIAAKHPGLKLVAERIGDGQATTALNITSDLVTANASLVGIFAANLPTAQGAGQAQAELRNARLSIVGFDSDPKLVQFLTEGVLAALIVQNPFRMGYDGVKTALAASKGENVPANVDTGVTVVTKANMGSAEIQALLNPKLD